MCDCTLEKVCLVAVVKAVQEKEKSVKSKAGIHVFVFEFLILATFQLLVLHIDVVADFNISSAVALHVALVTARIFVTRIEPLIVRSARCANRAFKLPPVVGLVKIEDVFFLDAKGFEV